MSRRTPETQRTDTLFTYSARFRSHAEPEHQHSNKAPRRMSFVTTGAQDCHRGGGPADRRHCPVLLVSRARPSGSPRAASVPRQHPTTARLPELTSLPASMKVFLVLDHLVMGGEFGPLIG